MQKKLFLSSLLLFAGLFCADKTLAQEDSTATVQMSGYVDVYYASYSDSLAPNSFQKFPSISPRSNQFGLNTAQINIQYDAEKVRGLVVLHYGDIPVSAWSGTFNNIMEAHAGVRLCKKLWLDAGFFRTHVGTEGLLPKENFASSISVNTFYEPYFESGVRLNYTANEKLVINFFVLNGYNIYEENNSKKSIGVLATYALGDIGNIGYNNYIGDDSPQGDTVKHTRIHQNLFLNYQIKKLKIQLGGDACVQQNSDTTGTKSASMFSGVASAKYLCCKMFSVYVRQEFFNDPQGFMSGVFTDSKNYQTGYILSGTTVGVEYNPSDNSYIRLEGRKLTMDENQQIFYWNSSSRNFRYEFMMNMGVSF